MKLGSRTVLSFYLKDKKFQPNSLLANKGMPLQSWKIECVYKTPFCKFGHIYIFSTHAVEVSFKLEILARNMLYNALFVTECFVVNLISAVCENKLDHYKLDFYNYFVILTKRAL